MNFIIEVLNNTINELVIYFQSPQWRAILQIIQIIAGILSFLFLIIIIYFLKTTGYLKDLFWENFIEFIAFKPYKKRDITKKISKKWKMILKRLKSTSESEWKLAVIEAEDFLDEILQKIGFEDKNFENKLKQIKRSDFSNIDIEDVYYAHKIRNNIVHNPNYQLNLKQAEKILSIYEKALRNFISF